MSIYRFFFKIFQPRVNILGVKLIIFIFLIIFWARALNVLAEESYKLSKHKILEYHGKAVITNRIRLPSTVYQQGKFKLEERIISKIDVSGYQGILDIYALQVNLREVINSSKKNGKLQVVFKKPLYYYDPATKVIKEQPSVLRITGDASALGDISFGSSNGKVKANGLVSFESKICYTGLIYSMVVSSPLVSISAGIVEIKVKDVVFTNHLGVGEQSQKAPVLRVVIYDDSSLTLQRHAYSSEGFILQGKTATLNIMPSGSNVIEGKISASRPGYGNVVYNNGGRVGEIGSSDKPVNNIVFDANSYTLEANIFTNNLELNGATLIPAGNDIVIYSGNQIELTGFVARGVKENDFYVLITQGAHLQEKSAEAEVVEVIEVIKEQELVPEPEVQSIQATESESVIAEVVAKEEEVIKEEVIKEKVVEAVITPALETTSDKALQPKEESVQDLSEQVETLVLEAEQKPEPEPKQEQIYDQDLSETERAEDAEEDERIRQIDIRKRDEGFIPAENQVNLVAAKPEFQRDNQQVVIPEKQESQVLIQDALPKETSSGDNQNQLVLETVALKEENLEENNQDLDHGKSYSRFNEDKLDLAMIERLQNEVMSLITQAVNTRVNNFNIDHLGTAIIPVSFLTTGDIKGASSGDKGLNAGDDQDFISKGLWVSGLYGSSNKGSSKNTSSKGYLGNIFGGTIGFDLSLSEESLIGAAYSYVKSDFKYKKAGGKLEARSNSLSIYGQQQIDRWILRGLASLNLSGNESRLNRRVASSGFQIARAEFKNTAIIGEAMLGYQINQEFGAVVMPYVAIRGGYYKDSGYKETGAGFMNLEVRPCINKKLTAITGVRVSAPHILIANAVITPNFTFSAEHYFDPDKPKIKARLAWMDNYFEYKPSDIDMPKVGFNIGVGLAIKRGNLEFLTSYICHLENKYKNHQGSLRIKILF